MSRQLPPRPNLEYLKNQAKEWLTDLRLRDPHAQLSDAQHALAREYGFPSWPKLKAFVAGPHVFAGRWRANLAKSTCHPDNVIRSAVLNVDIAGHTVTIADATVDAAGREERRVNVIEADGDEHPSPAGHGYSLRATWTGSRLLETVATQHGTIVGWGRYEISDDGMVLTISADRTRVVFDRTQ